MNLLHPMLYPHSNIRHTIQPQSPPKRIPHRPRIIIPHNRQLRRLTRPCYHIKRILPINRPHLRPIIQRHRTDIRNTQRNRTDKNKCSRRRYQVKLWTSAISAEGYLSYRSILDELPKHLRGRNLNLDPGQRLPKSRYRRYCISMSPQSQSCILARKVF
jgi:hypothetical protein